MNQPALQASQIGGLISSELAALADAVETGQVSDAWEPSQGLAALADPAALLSADPATLRAVATLLAGAEQAIRGGGARVEWV
jgi:hypothetical protein